MSTERSRGGSHLVWESVERFCDRTGREVMIVFDHNRLVELWDRLSVDCDFDHVQLWFAVLWVGGRTMKARYDREGGL